MTHPNKITDPVDIITYGSVLMLKICNQMRKQGRVVLSMDEQDEFAKMCREWQDAYNNMVSAALANHQGKRQ